MSYERFAERIQGIAEEEGCTVEELTGYPMMIENWISVWEVKSIGLLLNETIWSYFQFLQLFIIMLQ